MDNETRHITIVAQIVPLGCSSRPLLALDTKAKLSLRYCLYGSTSLLYSLSRCCRILQIPLKTCSRGGPWSRRDHKEL